MIQTLITLGILNFFAAMSPGPDFAIVTKNTLLHGRRSGVMTALGIATAILIHVSYCLLGLCVCGCLWVCLREWDCKLECECECNRVGVGVCA